MNDNDEDTRSNTESENNRQSEQNNNLNNDAQKSNNDDNNSDEISIEDNNLIAWDEVEEDDDAYISEEITNNLTASEEDFEFDQITAHKWEEGLLIVKVELKSGKDYEVPFHLLKKDRPLELAKYIEREVIETKRGGKYETWAKNIIKRSSRTIRRLSRSYNIDRTIRLEYTKEKTRKLRRISKNKRNEKKKNREKFGIRIPNSAREALLFDKQNGNHL